MRRSRMIVEVYNELRKAMAGRASAAELLRCAAEVVKAFSGSGEPEFEMREGLLPFDCWSVDSAIADGGWRILCAELGDGYEMGREDADEFRSHLAWKQIHGGIHA